MAYWYIKQHECFSETERNTEQKIFCTTRDSVLLYSYEILEQENLTGYRKEL